jgi:E3 ubiquitin-protein ligase UBR1
VFTPAARAEILTKLYAALMGPNQKYFLPQGVNHVPTGQLLGEYQASVGFPGPGKEDGSGPVEGRACSHIFRKGESCYRCKCANLFYGL